MGLRFVSKVVLVVLLLSIVLGTTRQAQAGELYKAWICHVSDGGEDEPFIACYGRVTGPDSEIEQLRNVDPAPSIYPEPVPPTYLQVIPQWLGTGP